MDDEVTISRLLAGEPETIAVVRRWIRAAFSPYRRRLGAELEDVEQEVLLDLTRALGDDTFEGRSQLRTYVRTYVHHKCIDRLRAESRREMVDIAELELPSTAPSADEQLSQIESTRLALEILESMPEPCREVWRLLQQGMRYREMSRQLGIPEGALRARVLRCRRRALEMREEIFRARRITKSPAERLGK